MWLSCPWSPECIHCNRVREVVRKLRDAQQLYGEKWNEPHKPSNWWPPPCESPVEEWRAAWNDVVDFHAGLVNQQRDPGLASLLQQDLACFVLFFKALRDGRQCLLSVADSQAQTASHMPLFDAVISADASDWGCLAQRVTLYNLAARSLDAAPSFLRIWLTRFVRQAQLLNHLYNLEDSYVPCQHQADATFLFPPYPRTSYLHSSRRKAADCEVFDAGHFLCNGLNRTRAGIAFPCDGLVVQVSTITLREIYGTLNSLRASGARLISAELARLRCTAARLSLANPSELNIAFIKAMFRGEI